MLLAFLIWFIFTGISNTSNRFRLWKILSQLGIFFKIILYHLTRVNKWHSKYTCTTAVSWKHTQILHKYFPTTTSFWLMNKMLFKVKCVCRPNTHTGKSDKQPDITIYKNLSRLNTNNLCLEWVVLSYIQQYSMLTWSVWSPTMRKSPSLETFSRKSKWPTSDFG